MQYTEEKEDRRQEIITRFSRNDELALKKVYADHYPAVEKYILNNSGTHDDAKDVFQESFLAFWRNVQLGRFEAGHAHAVGGYLMRIARNKWIDTLRKNKKMKTNALADDYVDDPADPALSEEEEQYLGLIKSHYQKMGEPCKSLLHRFYFKKEKLKQIASYFSWTEATAKNNKYRCLQKLRNAVTKTS